MSEKKLRVDLKRNHLVVRAASNPIFWTVLRFLLILIVNLFFVQKMFEIFKKDI